MGYQPNHAARTLVTGCSNLIGFHLARLNAPYAAEIAHRLQAIVRTDGYEVLVHEYLGSDKNLNAVVDGTILLDCILYPHKPYPSLDSPVPCVAVGASYLDTVDFVGVDLEEPSRQAMRRLLAAGRKRVLYIGGRNEYTDSPDGRYVAYSSSMWESGNREEILVPCEDSRKEAYGVLSDYLMRGALPDAIFCRNDEIASGCYRALRERGLRIPDDVAVVGCDGIEETAFYSPPLTTIVMPVEQMCRTGWEFLKRRMASRDVEQQRVVIPAHLEIRESG